MALTQIDRSLLKRCVANERGAWRDFVDRFVGLFVHVVNHTAHTRSVRITPDAVDDLCAEIFLAIVANDFRVLREFRGNCSLATYLSVVARRIAVREMTKRRMSEALGHVSASGSHKRPEVAKAPDAEASAEQERVDNRDEVDQMLQGLPEKDAEIVRQYHLQGRTYREISDNVGVPENTIGSTLTRARRRLRKRSVSP